MKRVFFITLFTSLLWSQESPWAPPVYLPLKDAQEREQLRQGGAPEGTLVKGREDSCLYYLHAGSWFRLCGECSPLPAPVQIDSISTGMGDLYVSWKGDPLKEGEVVEALILPDSLRQMGVGPSFYFTLKSGGWYRVLLRRKGRCGNSPWVERDSIRVTYKQCPSATLEGKPVELLAIGSTCWANQDWEGPPNLAANRQKDGSRYFSNRQIEAIRRAIPPGWRLPTLRECEALLNVLNIAPQRLEKFAPSKKGAYAPSEKRWVGVNEASIYLIGDAPDKVLVINPLGGLIAPLEGQEVHARLRLVRAGE